MRPGRYLQDQRRCSVFTYHGKPVSAQDAIDIMRRRREWRRDLLERLRDQDQRASAPHRQLWSMLKNLLNRKGAA